MSKLQRLKDIASRYTDAELKKKCHEILSKIQNISKDPADVALHGKIMSTPKKHSLKSFRDFK